MLFTPNTMFNQLFDAIGVAPLYAEEGLRLNHSSGALLLLPLIYTTTHWLLPPIHAFYGDRNAVEGEEEVSFRLVSFSAGENVKLRFLRVACATYPNILSSMATM